MNKAIILNSGGFDSVVMINSLVNTTDTEFISLFFNYGQRNMKLERECARKVAEKFNLQHIEIDLPKLSWSNSTLCDKKNPTFVEYLEMRNVIFLSYAMSLAESVKAEAIYSAILVNGKYTDTNKDFIEATRTYLNHFNIRFETPFSTRDKDDLGYLARAYDITKEDFFTCNNPKGKKPCNKCGDCLALNEIYDVIVDNNTTIKEWVKNGVTDRFKHLYLTNPIGEARLLINNKCQFDCKHCFYGFDETISPDLSFEEMCGVIDQIAEIKSIKNIHFSGKEPLYNDLIFKYAEYIKEKHPHLTYDVVTNGVALPKYAEKIKEHGFRKVYLSVDDVDPNNLTIRPVGSFIINNIKLLQSHDIPVEVFLDAHKGNVSKIKDMIIYLHEEFKINEFFVRTVCPLGKGKTLNNILDVADMEQLHLDLKSIRGAEDLTIAFHTQSGFTKAILEKEEGSELLNDICFVADTSFPYVTPHLRLFAEFFCSPCEDQITITSDGYLLGCATEVSSKNYDKISGGNVRDYSLSKLISIKRKMSLQMLDRQKGENIRPCYHTFYKIN